MSFTRRHISVVKDHGDKVIVFVVPHNIMEGVQNPHIKFPFDGNIVSIEGSVSNVGGSDTVINIEKSVDYSDWVVVTEKPVVIEANNHFSNDDYVVSDPEVKAGDVFRLNVLNPSNASNLSVNIKIQLSN